jgi:alpha-beta hydrolase superfamily lysophospholipase
VAYDSAWVREGPSRGASMLESAFRLLRSALACALVGLGLVAAGAYGWFIFHGPEPKVWHTARLTQEFTAARAGEVGTIAAYRHLEDRLFAELEEKVLDRVQPEDRNAFNRFNAGSRSDPAAWPTNWNRTFEIAPPEARGAALLLHGLSDSPYSMRSVAEHLAAGGLDVVGLRLPGHGTAPSGLLSFEIEDMQAAVRMAMRDLRHRLGPERPIYLVGYSTGAALAVDYTLHVMEGANEPRPAALVLISPAIAVSRLAALARVKTGLSSVPGFGRAAWQEIVTEFDPFKYSSFSFHAAGEVQRLTSDVDGRIRRLAKPGPIRDFPPVLAFLSTVDATISAPAVAHMLFDRLAPDRHELVLFDVNRLSIVRPLLVADPGPLTGQLLAMPNRPFALTVITNASPDTAQVQELRAEAGSSSQSSRPLPWSWPRDVFSLSHVALPFPPDDSLYGYEAVRDRGHVQLGRVDVHGENGVLAIPDWVLTRQRSNPFHAYMLERIDGFLSGATTAPPPP